MQIQVSHSLALDIYAVKNACAIGFLTLHDVLLLYRQEKMSHVTITVWQYGNTAWQFCKLVLHVLINLNVYPISYRVEYLLQTVGSTTPVMLWPVLFLKSLQLLHGVFIKGYSSWYSHSGHAVHPEFIKYSPLLQATMTACM